MTTLLLLPLLLLLLLHWLNAYAMSIVSAVCTNLSYVYCFAVTTLHCTARCIGSLQICCVNVYYHIITLHDI
jgi:hypothetical protein